MAHPCGAVPPGIAQALQYFRCSLLCLNSGLAALQILAGAGGPSKLKFVREPFSTSAGGVNPPCGKILPQAKCLYALSRAPLCGAPPTPAWEPVVFSGVV